MTTRPGDHGGAPPPEGEARRWLDDEDNVWRLIHIFWGLCALLFVIDLPALFGLEVYDKHGVFRWEHFPGFHAVYGFVACVALVEAAKLLRKLVMRPEDYYRDL